MADGSVDRGAFMASVDGDAVGFGVEELPVGRGWPVAWVEAVGDGFGPVGERESGKRIVPVLGRLDFGSALGVVALAVDAGFTPAASRLLWVASRRAEEGEVRRRVVLFSAGGGVDATVE